MDVLFGKPPKMHRDTSTPPAPRWPELSTDALDLSEAGLRVLAHPTVAAKNFLITIGDRTVGGLTARDQMVGPWQMPVADCAITLGRLRRLRGRGDGGRRTHAARAARRRRRRAHGRGRGDHQPVRRTGRSLDRIKLSANWMAAAGHPGEDAKLFDAVRAVGLELCPELDLSIPVGKDSLSMQAQWHHDGVAQKSVSPVSLIVTAFAPVDDVRKQLTPLLGARTNRRSG